ncbi:YraN family protein [Candidatus Viridilinea mediisalina]|uniref:UPF0102 protein CJ255_10935 n=1 Tax=Candidatus Viridilinea mediisalina TaxID=2024553 RepID=A0A2A6RJG1_9CHLR|nr:YraN family protein [Candidatus Viridilinea mediisalina]PDW03029.1 hypothetical protein CJ255_10935 [Candidatus Viridilinea mediisalina]
MSGANTPLARRNLGLCGEAAAAAHLRRAGWHIIARNWRCSVGEIDLIAQRGGLLAFVEVRTRRAGMLQGPSPEESITPTKARRLVTLAYSYLEAAAIPPDSLWRIDLIAVELDYSGRVVRLTQIEHAVEGET